MHGSARALRICRNALYTSLVLLLSPDRRSPEVQLHLLSTATVARRGATMASPASSKHFPRSEARSHNAANRWTTRIIPIFLLAVIGFACWALTKPICSESNYAPRDIRRPLTQGIASTQLTSLSLENKSAAQSSFLSSITSS